MSGTARRLARLGRALRAEGVGTTLRDELDAAGALSLVDREDRREVRTTLRIALKVPREHFETLDRVLPVFWGAELPGRTTPSRPLPAPRLGQGRLLHWDPETRRMGELPGASPEGGEEPGYSPEAVLRRKRFDDPSWSPRDLATMERLLQRLARKLATRPSRRLVPTRGRGRADLRASYRRALGTQGELLAFARRARAIEEPRLVFLLDTSGSMDAHSRFLLSFLLALRRAAPRAEAFVFNTELVRVTRWLAPGKLELTLARLTKGVPDWSGGTRIGLSLQSFVRDHLQATVDGRTVVVVVSDGLDRGDPMVLADALAAIRQRARKLLWLNPLLGDPRYRPEARGMRAALPFLDHLAAAHDFDSLARLLPRLAG